VAGAFKLLVLIHDGDTKSYLARHPSFDRTVMLHLLPQPGSAACDELIGLMESLSPAAQGMILERGEENGAGYLVTDKIVDFRNLRDWLVKAAVALPVSPVPAEPAPPEPPAPAPASFADASSLASRARILASLPLLRAVPMQILVELANLAVLRELEPEESLFAAGVPPGRVFIVTRGRVEARRAEPVVSGVFVAGSIVGGALCLGDSEAAWSARALGRSQVLSFSVEDLLDHLEEHQDGVRAMMAAFALERERLCEELATRLGELVLQ